MTMDPHLFGTRASLRDDLRRMGIVAGDMIMVHAAMSKVGPLLNGPDALIGALCDVIGQDGTLLAYASWDSVHDDLLDEQGRVLTQWRDHVPGFDAARSRAVRMNGILPEFIRTTPGALRSGNPGASIVAIGREAGAITADHPQDYGFGENTPLARLVAKSGRVLMIGAPWDTMTLIHHADHLARVPDKQVLRYEVPFAAKDGTHWRFIEEFDTCDPPIEGMPEDYIEQIVQAFVAQGQARQGMIGKAPSLLVEAPAILRHAIGWLEDWVAGHHPG